MVGMFRLINRQYKFKRFDLCSLAWTYRVESTTKPRESFGRRGFSFLRGDGCGPKLGKGAHKTEVGPKLACSIYMTPSKANPDQFGWDTKNRRDNNLRESEIKPNCYLPNAPPSHYRVPAIFVLKGRNSFPPLFLFIITTIWNTDKTS
jgi:hypothetical protein